MEWLEPNFLNTRIQLLDSFRFTDLVSDLLMETAARNKIDRAYIATNFRITDPDGGIDARCSNAPNTVGGFIPRPNVDYQFKSGKRKTTKQIAKEDVIGKRRVIDGLNAGHGFVYVAAWDHGDRASEDLRKELLSKRVKVAEGQVIFIGVDRVARMLRAFPALIAKYVGLPDQLDSIDDWSSYRTLNNPFEVDDDVRTRLDSLRSAIEVEGSTVRITGVPGDGKTRLTLEALRGSALESSVLYTRQARDVGAALASFLRKTPDIRCTLVIDEVNDETAEKLIDRFSSRTSGELRLVMIGLDSPGRIGTGIFEVPKLSRAVLCAIIKALVPALPDDEARAIASDCERSPKLAVLIAKRVQEDPSLVTNRGFLVEPGVRSALDRYIPLDATEWKALSAASILTKLGWSGNVEAESEVLFGVLGLDPVRARGNIEVLHERYGVAPMAGRFRYVSPAVLADYLAAREIGPWTQTRYATVFSAMPPPMKDSFARRLRGLSAVLKNREIIEEVTLGSQGPFRSIADLESESTRTLLTQLADPFPQATLRALERVILSASVDELRAADNSRRDLVWALEQLLWREETFIGASALVLRLAVAENETWANNATGLWTDTFQTRLGGTAAGVGPRLNVLRAAASGADPVERQLAAKALDKALASSDVMTGRNLPWRDAAGTLIEPWEPATYGEWADAYCMYLSLLKPLVTDPYDAVRGEASKALRTALSATFRLPVKAFDEWVLVASSLVRSNSDLRLELLTAVEFALARCKYSVSEKGLRTEAGHEVNEDERQRITEFFQSRAERLSELASELAGDDFSIRFRATITRRERTFHEDYYEAVRLSREALVEFAREGIANPNALESEWEWLLDEKNFHSSIRWIEVLGKLDNELRLRPTLARIAKEHPEAIMWRSIYEVSYAREHNDPSHIDRCLAALQSAPDSGFQMFDLIFRAGYQPSRVPYLERLFESGAVEAELLAHLAYWRPELPPQDAVKLISAVVRHGAQFTTFLPFLETYLSQSPSATVTFRDLVVPILLSARGVELNDMQFESWCKLAKHYVDQSPIDIASLALELSNPPGRRHRQTDEIKELLNHAWRAAGGTEFFERVVASWIDSDLPESFWAREQLPGHLLTTLKSEYLPAWVSQNAEKRARRLAGMLGAPGATPSDLHAELLRLYDSYGVGSTLYSEYMTGFYFGSHSAWIRGQLEHARRWLADPRLAVREWGKGVVRDLEDRLKRVVAGEEEERFE